MPKSYIINVPSMVQNSNFIEIKRGTSLNLIEANKVREIWIDKFRRALILPLKTGLKLVSIDIYFPNWIFQINDEIQLDNERLVYHRPEKPEDIGIIDHKEVIERIEIIGHISEEVKETISIRVWIKPMDNIDNIIKGIYSEVKNHLEKRIHQTK